MRDVPLVGRQAERGIEAVKAAVREFLQPPAFFEALGVRYVGPVDGHDIEALEQALRNAIELSAEGPIVVHVLTQKGRGLRARRGRRREAPPRRPGVRPARRARPRPCRPATPRPSPRRSSRRPRPTRRRRDHRRDARSDRPAAVPGALPRPLLRRRHRRAARRHRRRRHGDGRAAPGRRHLLDVPHPGVGPGRLRRRRCTACRSCSASTAPASPATTARATTACYDMALLAKVPGMTVLAPVVAPRSCSQMLHDALDARRRRPGRHPLPEGAGPPGRRARGRPRPRRRDQLRAGDGRVCILGVGQDASATPSGRPPTLAAERRRRHAVGRPVCAAARSGDDRRRRPPRGRGHRRGRHPRRRRRRWRSTPSTGCASAERAAGPACEVLGRARRSSSPTASPTTSSPSSASTPTASPQRSAPPSRNRCGSVLRCRKRRNPTHLAPKERFAPIVRGAG